jgi:hypothetical protein
MDIVFSTFNARYSHTALSLRCLRANLGSLHDHSVIVEFDNRLSPYSAAEKLLSYNPKIILFSIYIWNLVLTYETVAVLRTVNPEIKIVIGGPEVSYEYNDSLIVQQADHLVCGEGEGVIAGLCRDLLDGESRPEIIHAPPADLHRIELPYNEYTEEDIAHRRIYVETSRGCPFTCQYCLSAVEPGVRFFPQEQIFPAFKKLIDRGARIFKFLDRSFNINTAHAAAVLQFFFDNRQDGMMLHLEWEPERFPPILEKMITEAPPGFFQLEVGVQTFNPEVAARIERNLHTEQIETHIRALAAASSVHLHADLIAGLPGEDLESISRGFDCLHACGPQEIQLGILKKLRGAPIARHDVEWQMVYNTSPPYDVLQTSTLSFVELQQIRRFARFWDITVNSGRFPHTAPLLWKNRSSVFAAFMEWSEWLYRKTGSTAGIAPPRLARLLEEFLIEKRPLSAETVSCAIQCDQNSISRGSKGMERQTRSDIPKNTKSV